MRFGDDRDERDELENNIMGDWECELCSSVNSFGQRDCRICGTKHAFQKKKLNAGPSVLSGSKRRGRSPGRSERAAGVPKPKRARPPKDGRQMVRRQSSGGYIGHLRRKRRRKRLSWLSFINNNLVTLAL